MRKQKVLKIKIYKNHNFTYLFYGYETWSLTLKEEHRLRVFEKRVARRIFGPKMKDLAGGWRSLHSD
jgi:hypothetical protein